MSSEWIRVGTAVRHKTWGVGEVVAIEGGKCMVRFAAETKALEYARAATWLEPTDEPVPPTVVVKPTSSKPRPPGTGVKCSCCKATLRSSIYRDGERWKSCPSCSGANGAQHVLRRNPEDFGTTDLRASESTPEGVQSHCASCRANEAATDPGRLCSSFS